MLDLNGNRLLGEIPTSIGNLTQLFLLDLDEIKLEGSIPPCLGNCQHFQLLDISQNNLSGFIPPTAYLPFQYYVTRLTTHLPANYLQVGNLKNTY